MSPTLITCSKGRCGVTLLEMLIYVAVIMLVSTATLRILGDGRALRERAKHRAELALLAQSELDRLRDEATPAEGTRAYRREAWPPQVTARQTVRRHEDGLLELQVQLARAGESGAVAVELTTLRAAGE